MARQFTAASSERLRATTLAGSALEIDQSATGITLAAIAYFNAIDSREAIFTVDSTAPSTVEWGLEAYSSSGEFALSAGSIGSPRTGTSHLSSATWYLLAATVGTGTATPVLYRYVYSTDTWTQTNGSLSVNQGALATPTVTFGQSDGGAYADVTIQLAGVWNRALTTEEVKRLPDSLLQWFYTAPVGLWLFDQESTSVPVADLTGNKSNQSSISGTSIWTGSVPSFSHGLPIQMTGAEPPPAATFTLSGTVATGVDDTTFGIAASVTSGDLLLLFCHVANIGSGDTPPTVASVSDTFGSLSWQFAATVYYDQSGNSKDRMYLYWAEATTTTSGTVTITTSSTAGTFFGHLISVEPSTSWGTAPLKQVVTNTGNGTAPSATLAAGTGNVVAAFGHSQPEGTTLGGNMTAELGDSFNSSPWSSMQTAYRSSHTTTPNASFATTSDWGVIAVELQEATDAPATPSPSGTGSLLLMGA